MSEFRLPVRLGGHPRFEGIDGSGFSTVIIDSGINLNHPFFRADSNGDGVADRDRVVHSFDFAGDDPNADDTDGHGTNVASIAAGLDPAGNLTGMASGANIINLKVFPDGTETKASSGDIEQALQWVVANARNFNIASVNLSLGEGNYDKERTSGLSDEYRTLADLGVIVVICAGNDYDDEPGRTDVPGVTNHSADPNTLSVGAVWDTAYLGVAESGADRIASFSQRHATLLDIFAPGARITGAGLGDTPGTANFLSAMSGTSQAAPHVAGIAVLA
jgi:subtilisin family serine protease